MRTNDNMTPLYLACREGVTEAVQSLLRGGADTNTPSGENRQTPLMAAIAGDHHKIANMIIKVRIEFSFFIFISGNQLAIKHMGQASYQVFIGRYAFLYLKKKEVIKQLAHTYKDYRILRNKRTPLINAPP